MRRTVTHLVSLALVSVGLALAAPAGAVTGGEHDGSRHPNVGALLIGTPGVDMFALCSGSLIAPDEFLTAGHCTDFLDANAEPGDVSVTFEELLNPDPVTGALAPATTVAVSGWSTMPGFKAGIAKSINDIGVVHLARPVTGIRPADLPSAGFLDGAQAAGLLNGHVFTNVGYGLNGLDRSIVSKHVAVSWEARRMLSTSRFKSLTPIFLKQQGGICFGDSGGPHFWATTGPLSNLTVAVTSATNPTCGALAENQRLDTPEAVAFLSAFVP
jgi:hypothetical protein